VPEFGELVHVAPDEGHTAGKCPFCPIEKKKIAKTSYIGKHNDSKKLGTNLEAAGDSKAQHLYFDVEYEIYRNYSAEAHHLICGNEVLKEEGVVEKYLIEDAKTTSKGSAGFLKPNDVGYDVNSAENGIWLPSVPDMFRKTKTEPMRWWGDQTAWNRKHPMKPARVSLDEWEKADAAFIVMEAVKRQFHKASHGDVGEPDDNYVEMAIGRLRQVTVFLKHFADKCPMEDDGSCRKKPPYYPPYGVISLLNALSKNLARELDGHPDTWNYFISEYARDCSIWWKRA
jgi:hypothetical protein